jgi:hypothetical protein
LNAEQETTTTIAYRSVAVQGASIFYREAGDPANPVSGRGDPLFTEAGAHAWLRDLPRAGLHLLESGHFALEKKPRLQAGCPGLPRRIEA